MERFMDQKLILKFTMLFADNINVELYNVISNYQLDLIFSTKQKEQLKNKLMLLNIKQSNKNKSITPNYLKRTIWMIMILHGLSILLNPALRDLLLFTELFLVQLNVSWQS